MLVSRASLGSRRALLPCRVVALNRNKSSAAALAEDHSSPHPTLHHVPSLPVVGSLLKPYSNIPYGLDPAFSYKTWPELSQKYGDFYTIGIPGMLDRENIIQ